MPNVVIVGAGITGLTLAYRLQEQVPNCEFVLLEEAARPGGVIETTTRDGYLVEGGPNGFPDNNPATLDLARSLGLEGSLLSASEAASKNRFLFLDGRLRMLPSSLPSFLRSDLLSWVAKLRILTERYRPRRRDDAEESIDAFARRRVGDEVARTFADAFITGVLAGDPKLLSVNAAFPRLCNWEREHGSVLRGMAAARKQRAGARAGKLWTFRDGLGSLVESLAGRLRSAPKLKTSVRRVSREATGWRVHGEGRYDADAVVLTCPANRQAELLGDLDADLGARLGGIAYNRVVVVALGYRREDVPHALDGFGYLSRQRERRDVLGVQWCSSIYAGRAPEGRVLLRAMCGGWHRGEMVDWPDEQLVAAVRGEMARTVGVRVAPEFVQVKRWPRAIPQYHVGHLGRVAAIERRLESLPGLFLGGNSFRGVAINDCVEQAGLLAVRVADYLRQHRHQGESA